MDWFFRGHFPNRRPNLSYDDENHENDDFTEGFGMRDPFGFPFANPFNNVEEAPQDIFQRMDEMLNRVFFSSDPSFGNEHVNSLLQEESDPRAMMLKDPECKTCDPSNVTPFIGRPSSTLVDSDIDDSVARNRWILGENPSIRDQSNFSYKRFSSIKTVRMADGTLEEHRTVTDGSGETTTTVRRSIGDQMHEITTHSDKSGLKEKLENFTNLDENGMAEFDRRWKNIKSGNAITAPEIKQKIPENNLTVPTGDASYLTLFKKFFGY